MTRPKRKSRRWLWFLAVALILVVAGGAYYYQTTVQSTVKTTTTLKTAKVKKADITLTASGTAKLIPATDIDLSFKSGGRLAELLVKEGDQAQAGQPLARLDDTDARAQIAKSQIDLAIAETKLAGLTAINPLDVAVAQADLEKVAVSLRKAQEAYNVVAWRSDVGMLPQSATLEQASLDFQKAKATYELKVAGPSATDVRGAQLQVDLAKAALANAHTTLDNLTLKAPVAGTISALKVAAGEQVGTSPVMTLIDLSKALVEIVVDETELSKVAAGHPVEVAFDALPNQTFQGTIVRVSPTVILVSNVSSLFSVAELKQPAPVLKVGMSGSARITAASVKQVLTVPVEAVREIAPGQSAVFVVDDATQQLTLRPVEIGLKGTTLVEIKSGLQLGETVSTGTVATQ